MDVPIQAARRADNTFLLKFRPLIAGDYSIFLKDGKEQSLPGKNEKATLVNRTLIDLLFFSRSNSRFAVQFSRLQSVRCPNGNFQSVSIDRRLSPDL